jgi:hypothetical protein
VIRLTVYVEDIANVLTAGYTVVRVYMATTSGGSYAHQADLLTTLTTGVTTYTVLDIDGVSTNYYKTAYYGGTPGESEFSEPMTGTLTTYCDVSDVRDYWRGDRWTTDGIRDGYVADLCRMVTAEIDGAIGRTLFHSSSITETTRSRVRYDGALHLFPVRRPINSVSAASYKFYLTDTAISFVVADTVQIDGSQVLIYTGLSPTDGTRPLTVTLVYDGGYTTIPDDIRRAATRTVAYWLDQRAKGIFDVTLDLVSQIKAMPDLFPVDVKLTLSRYGPL